MNTTIRILAALALSSMTIGELAIALTLDAETVRAGIDRLAARTAVQRRVRVTNKSGRQPFEYFLTGKGQIRNVCPVWEALDGLAA